MAVSDHKSLRWRFGQFCLLALLASSGQAANPSEHEQRQAVVNEAFQLWRDKDYAGLNRLQQDLIQQKRRSESGVWLLAPFNNGIAQFGRPRGRDLPVAVWEKLVADTLEWQQADPDSTMPPIRLARLYLEQAWELRGGTFVAHVPKENWPAIFLLTDQAKQVLLSVKERAAGDPHWYTAMLDVLRLNGDEALFVQTLNEGMARFPDYHELYFSAAITLQPKWGGSLATIRRLAQEAVKRNPNAEGPTLYARIYWSLGPSLDNDSTTLVDWRKSDWKRLKASFDSLVTLYPSSWNRTAYASFACRALDLKTMDQQFSVLGYELTPGAWHKSGQGKSPSYCRALLKAYVDKGRKPLSDDELAQFDAKQLMEEAKRLSQPTPFPVINNLNQY
ncbi:hypothetical protein [Chitinimonas taiwanensis]|uniref:DUF4034 domain-containing protein n=1 Tax=Chitinimonas taiwanensis DSM 18899 TaxID=1121279 RepID=A0A1K2HJ00_9NEIS|nr:hypothetical protein [Chitinimonas taiwanensis]SFZ76734.1 hypothetical protein SAMN02745887_02098 [Chitinimonas taiwanensis DSM 18899]